MIRQAAAALAAVFIAAPALAWGGEGHEAVSYMALDAMEEALGDDMPQWLASRVFRDRVAYQSNEPDRYRSIRADVMSHENNPEHFLDVEMLEDYGWTLRTIPRLRNEFIGEIMIARTQRPGGFEPWDRERDSSMSYIWPGFGPYAMMEHYWKLRSSFRLVRLLDQFAGNDPKRRAELRQARANAAYHMGMLSHFVGDHAQPLHTTVHHHGWIGDNPEGYTTEYGFHAYIDSGVLRHHALVYDTVKPLATVTPPAIDPEDPWDAVLDHIQRSFNEVERTYRDHRDGVLVAEEGKVFIVERLADGAATLAGLYIAAWRGSELTDGDVQNYLRYEPGMGGEGE